MDKRAALAGAEPVDSLPGEFIPSLLVPDHSQPCSLLRWGQFRMLG